MALLANQIRFLEPPRELDVDFIYALANQKRADDLTGS